MSRRCKKGASSANVALQEAERLDSVRSDSQERIRADFVELGVEVPENSDARRALETAIEENERNLGLLAEVRARGETLALSLARTGQISRQAEVERRCAH